MNFWANFIPADPWEALKGWLDEMVEVVKKPFIVVVTRVNRNKKEKTSK